MLIGGTPRRDCGEIFWRIYIVLLFSSFFVVLGNLFEGFVGLGLIGLTRKKVFLGICFRFLFEGLCGLLLKMDSFGFFLKQRQGLADDRSGLFRHK
jgi:hypothetical protein